jgi:hypothetical protein
MDCDRISSSFGLWRKVEIIAMLPSPWQGEGLGVRSAMQIAIAQTSSKGGELCTESDEREL